MEDLIKFIPIALYVAYKLFGGSKKKEQKPNSRPKSTKRKTTQKSTPSLQDILRELSGEKVPQKEVQPKVEKEYESIVEQRKRERIKIEDHQYDFRPEYEHHADVDLNLAEVRAEISRSQGLKVETAEDNKREAVGFDLRQGIIAQTILNRPDF